MYVSCARVSLTQTAGVTIQISHQKLFDDAVDEPIRSTVRSLFMNLGYNPPSAFGPIVLRVLRTRQV